MGKIYVENSLKRFLKRKVKITLGLVVTFMITGAVSFAESTAEEGSTQWHKEQAENWLKGYGKNEFPNVSGDKVSITADGKINFDGKEIDLSSLKGNLSNKEKGILTAMGNIVNGKDNSIDMSDVEGYNEGLNAEVSNKGILNDVQTVDKEVGYNYGIINNTNGTGQNLTKESGKQYNYGIISNSKNYGQAITTHFGSQYNFGVVLNSGSFGQVASTKETKTYNYGILANNKIAQAITAGTGEIYNYGVITNSETGQELRVNGNIYNYGIITNVSNQGQLIKNGVSYNYGKIESNSIGQNIEAGKSYNFGIISTNNSFAIQNKGIEAKNFGVVETGTGNIFSGKVDNEGIIILTNNTSKINLGTGENKGVILKNDYTLSDATYNNENVNKNVVELTESNKTIEQGKVYYANNVSGIEFDNNLKGNTLTAVITDKTDAVYKYTGEKLVLNDTTITGYFVNGGGTLLDLTNKNLTLGKGSIINAIGNNSIAIQLGENGSVTTIGSAHIVGKIEGGNNDNTSVENIAQNNNGETLVISDEVSAEQVIVRNANDIEKDLIDTGKNFTNIDYKNLHTDKLTLNFTNGETGVKDKINVGEKSEVKEINGSSSTRDIELSIEKIENIGSISLGKGNDTLVIAKNGEHKNVINMNDGNDTLEIKGFADGTAVGDNHHKEAGNTFDYKVNGAEKIVLNGEGWHIGENAELNEGTTAKAEEKTELHIADNSSLHVDMNNDYGKGKVTTSLDKMAGGADLSLTTGKDAEVKFVVGDKFNVSQKQFDVTPNYSIKEGANLGAAVIFKGTGKDGVVEEKDGKIALTVKGAEEYNGQLDDYKSVYDAMLGGLSGNKELRDAVNYSNESKLVGMIKGAGNTAEAFYTTGYAVTKDVTDTYMSVVDDFGRKAGKGEWIAYGKYVNSDTEFDGGKSSKGYDGDITGTVGMIEYGVNETTSYGVVYGQGDTEVDIQGGGKLDGDNTYFGGYVKHRTQGGFDLTGNVGHTKSELDLNLATSSGIYNMITSGKSDADALTFALKGKKDYFVTDTVKLQPVFGARYTLVNQDAVESSDANFRMDEQDVTIFEGMFGGNAVKEFDLYNGKLSLSAGAEYVLTDVSKSDDARYTLYGKEIALTGEEDIADSRIEGHVGIDYEHESGVGVDAKYEMIWTDKGDNSRVTAGISYRF